MGKHTRTLLVGLLLVQVGFVKNLHAQKLDEKSLPPAVELKPVPPEEIKVQEAAPAEIAVPIKKPVKPKVKPRTSIPFPSQCGFFKKQEKVNRKDALKRKVDFILVSKSLRRIVLFRGENPVKAYNMSLGFTPLGHKVMEGDGKTPEGQYFIEFKNWNSQFHRALRVSYPNARDKARARALDVSPGGNIMIHGEHYDDDKRVAIREYIAEHGRHDWTHGCLAVSNREIDEIYAHIDLKTFIEICP